MSDAETLTYSTHRIRAAALIVDDDDRLLLVKHVDPATGEVWWIPPGGKLEGRETIFDCVRREIWEETNLVAEVGKIVYVREVIEAEFDRRHMEIYLLGGGATGEIALGNSAGQEDEHYIRDARFLSRAGMADKLIFPPILTTQTFWDDLAAGFPTVRYLGLDAY